MAELTANQTRHTAEVVQLSSTVEELRTNQTRHTAEVVQLSSTVEELTTNQTRHTAEVVQLSSTVEELTANQTRHASEAVQLSKMVKEMQALHAADVATIHDMLKRIIPQDAVDIGCKVSVWSDWGTCTAQCGPGTRSRTRTVEKLGFADASVECPGAAESEACELKKCPVDCVIGNWTEWQDCIPSCGPDSKQRRYRKITTAGAHSGTECGATTEVKGCDAACPDGTCSGGVFRTVGDLVSDLSPQLPLCIVAPCTHARKPPSLHRC